MISAAAVLALPQSTGTARPSRAEETTMFTTDQAANEWNVCRDTVYAMIKSGMVRASRSSRRGHYRISAEQVQFFKSYPAFINQPKAAIQQLCRTVELVNTLSAERERRMKHTLKEFEKRLALLEAGGLARAA